DQAAAVGNDTQGTQFPTLAWKGLDTVKLSWLYASIRQVDYPMALARQFKCLWEGGDDGPFVLEIPAEIVQSLADCQADSGERIAAKLCAQYEFVASGWQAADIATAINDLGQFAREAQAQQT